MQDQEIHADNQGQLRRDAEGDRDRRDTRDDRSDHRDGLAHGRDQRHDVEVRRAQQPQPDGGEQAHDAGQDQLRGHPRTDLLHALASDRLDGWP